MALRERTLTLLIKAVSLTHAYLYPSFLSLLLNQAEKKNSENFCQWVLIKFVVRFAKHSPSEVTE